MTSKAMDRIFFGDNQFFGVNHASEDKARQQLMRFQDINHNLLKKRFVIVKIVILNVLV